MEVLTSLIHSLGLNSTLWTQLVIFLVTYFILNSLVFKPYFNAYEERERRTLGGKEDAQHLVSQTQALQSQYEERARAINEKIRQAYDLARTQASKEQSDILQSSKEDALAKTKVSRERVQSEMNEARASLSKEVDDVSNIISQKLLGVEHQSGV